MNGIAPIGVGSIICAHPDRESENPWLGIVRAVRVDYHNHRTYRVSQRQSVTTFDFLRSELFETVLTFEGPMCVACKCPDRW